MITITDIVSFILRYRSKGKAFNYGETPEQLYEYIQGSISDDCCLVDSDLFNNIKGVIVGELQRDTKRIYIVGIICTSKMALINFAKWLQQRHDREGYTISAKRRDKLIEYDTPRLLNKLIKTYGRVS